MGEEATVASSHLRAPALTPSNYRASGPLRRSTAGHNPAPLDSGRLDRVNSGELAGPVHRRG